MKKKQEHSTDSAMIDDTSLEHVILPDSLEQIWDNVFRNCKKLKEIVIPENVNYIDSDAFIGCTGLRRIILKSDKLESPVLLPDDIRDHVKIICR